MFDTMVPEQNALARKVGDGEISLFDKIDKYFVDVGEIGRK